MQKKKQFIAEAKFLRSFFYFDLVRNFGGVPLVLKQLSTTESLSVSRSSVADVYERIESDLKEVSSSLPYKSEMSYESGRANKGMAQALLAKAYLYQNKFDEAYLYADSVIRFGGYELEDDFNNVWSANDNSKEAIFEIQTSSNQSFTLGNPCPIITGARGVMPVGLGEHLLVICKELLKKQVTKYEEEQLLLYQESLLLANLMLYRSR